MMVRKVIVDDLNQLVDLCEAHAIYEGMDYLKKGKKQRLEKMLFQDNSALQCWVVAVEGCLVGYATAIKQYSTWDADWYLYLDCLFLSSSFRGKGIGKILMGKVFDYATSEGCNNIQWQTPSFNEEAIRFYKRLGAKSKLKQRFFWDI